MSLSFDKIILSTVMFLSRVVIGIGINLSSKVII